MDLGITRSIELVTQGLSTAAGLRSPHSVRPSFNLSQHPHSVISASQHNILPQHCTGAPVLVYLAPPLGPLG